MKELKAAIDHFVWEVDLSGLSAWGRRGIRVLRMAYVVARDLAGGQLNLHAMSLVYTTLLSLVPLLAVSFSVLKGFGVHNQIEPALATLLEPLGEKGVEVTSNVIGFVENTRAGVLGSVGLALLFYTVVSLIQKIERSFNFTWHVTHTRPLSQRFSDYLSVIIIGPVLVFSAAGITASVTSHAVVQSLAAIEPLGQLIQLFGRLVPYLLVIGAFTFIYVFVPNTKVRIGSALVGGLIAGILWQTTGWLFASFIANSAKYTAIYSVFATLILFMIWLYLSWLILLIGASIAFYHQHPEYLSVHRRELSMSNRMKEKVALLVMSLVGNNYYHGRPAWTVEALAQRLNIPMDATQMVVDSLSEHGLLARMADTPATYLPGQPLDVMKVRDMLTAVRVVGEEPYLNPRRLPKESAVEDVVDALSAAITGALDGQTLKDLALGGDQADVQGPGAEIRSTEKTGE